MVLSVSIGFNIFFTIQDRFKNVSYSESQKP